MKFIKRAIPHVLVAFGVFLLCWLARNKLHLIVVSGSSMEPAISDGAILKYGGWTPEAAKRGDIVLFRANGVGKTLIKRIIAFPGEEIAIVDGKIIIDGTELTQYSYGTIEYAGILSQAPLLLQEKEYFCIGDNYSNSCDSRSFGPVNEEWIIGCVLQ